MTANAASAPPSAARRSAGGTDPEIATLRRWLRRLDTPGELAGPDLVALLRRHRRLPSTDSPLAVGQAAVRLLTEAVERLRAPAGAPRNQQLPYIVLKTCYLDRTKRITAGMQLNMSERTLTRERTRALRLLQGELNSAPISGASSPHRAEPIPRISGFLDRPRYLRELDSLRTASKLVHVTGPRGVGKTCLVAEHVSGAASDLPVVWYQLRQGLNDTLVTFLLDLVGTLGNQLPIEHTQTLTDALTRHDSGIASRVALHALNDTKMLLVLDDYDLTEQDPGFTGFIEEATGRLGGLSVITISRHRERSRTGAAVLHLPPLTPDETAALLSHLRIDADQPLLDTLHRWTGGLPQLVKFAASWIKSATPAEIARGTSSLMEADDIQDFLLSSITDLIDPEDRHILAAASIFRERFNDDALAYVAERSRGQVLDTSRRLVRYYLATRGIDGEVAFFHTSVRDYIHARLPTEDKIQLHQRAAIWYERNSDLEQAQYHRNRGGSGGGSG